MNDELFAGRGYIWRETLPMLKDTWLLGHGPGAYALDFPQDPAMMPKVFESGGDYVGRPHDQYLNIATTSGNLAAIIFIVGLGYFCWAAWRARTARATAVLAGVVGFAVAALVDDPSVGVMSIFWVLLGAGFACL